MHILAPLMATLVLYAAARWLDEARERPAARWAVLYTLAAAGCLYTLYLAALAPLAANLYAAVALLRLPQARRRRVAAGWLGAQAAAQRQAVFPRHHEVEHDQVDPGRIQHLHHLRPVPGARHAIAMLGQELRDQRADFPVVIDHENARHDDSFFLGWRKATRTSHVTIKSKSRRTVCMIECI